MRKKQLLSLGLSALMITPTLFSLSACGRQDEIILRVYNWEEYMDEGGEGSYNHDYGIDNENSVIEDFELWYEETYNQPIRVEYSTFGTNEDMYNQLKLGDEYDLVCPSDYMIMKLAAEDMLAPFSQDFFDKSNENNYYVTNVSSYISNVFDSNYVSVNGQDFAWSEYAAGYMWGTTGLIYNPQFVNESDLQFWNVMLNPTYQNKLTTKDNVRDSYFVALAIVYQDELLTLKNKLDEKNISPTEYNQKLTEIMNRTDEQTVASIQRTLEEMKQNIYGFETDTGKNDMVTGKLWMNFAWSGDAVYAMDTAERPEDKNVEPVYLNYFIPEESSNLWFDGWVMPKGANVQAAQAFINFLSRSDIAVRNMYYIGYSSVIASDEVFAYVSDTYSVEEGDEADAVEYDVSYFFGEGAIISTYEEQLSRQLYAQYPPQDVTLRCAVMGYYSGEAGERINELWTKIKGESLDTWAIVVLCVTAVSIILFVLYVKFGSKLDFRRKPKKGYVKIDEKPIL